MNQFNTLRDNKPIESLREFNIQPTEVHFKSCTSPTKTIPVVLDIMGIINHNAIGNDDVEVYPWNYRFEYNSDSIPYMDANLIR